MECFMLNVKCKMMWCKWKYIRSEGFKVGSINWLGSINGYAMK